MAAQILDGPWDSIAPGVSKPKWRKILHMNNDILQSNIDVLVSNIDILIYLQNTNIYILNIGILA